MALPGSSVQSTNNGEDTAAHGAGSICRAGTALSTCACSLSFPPSPRHARVLSPGKDTPHVSNFSLFTRCVWHEKWTLCPTSFQTSRRPGAAEDRASSSQADGVNARCEQDTMQEALEEDRREACSGTDTGIQGEAEITGLVPGKAGKGSNTGPRCSRDQK